MKALYQQYLAFDENSLEHWLLLVLSQSVLVSLALTLCCALLALGLRIRHHRHERLWRGLHLLWDKDMLDVLSGDMSQIEFSKKIQPDQELNFIRFLAPYGWQLRGSDLGILQTLARHYMQPVVRQLRHKDAGVRVWAINVIGLFGMPEHEHGIFTALQDKASAVAMSAANTLLTQKRVAYIQPVLEHFYRFDKWNVRTLAGQLSGMGPEAIPVLEQIYLDDKRSTRTRIVAAEVLSNFADYAVADRAAALLSATVDLELAVATLRLLREVGPEKHRAALYPLCQAPSEVLRVNALRTLRALGLRADHDLFLHALDDSSPWVARQAAWALKELGNTATLERLVREDHPRAVLARQVLAERN